MVKECSLRVTTPCPGYAALPSGTPWIRRSTFGIPEGRAASPGRMADSTLGSTRLFFHRSSFIVHRSSLIRLHRNRIVLSRGDPQLAPALAPSPPKVGILRTGLGLEREQCFRVSWWVRLASRVKARRVWDFGF